MNYELSIHLTSLDNNYSKAFPQGKHDSGAVWMMRGRAPTHPVHVSLLWLVGCCVMMSESLLTFTSHVFTIPIPICNFQFNYIQFSPSLDVIKSNCEYAIRL